MHVNRTYASRNRRERVHASAVPPRLIFIDDLEAWVCEKNMKNVRIHVSGPDGRVDVSVPFGTPDDVVAKFVRAKRDWIVAKQTEIANSPMARAAGASDEEVKVWRAVVEAFTPALVAKWEPILGVHANKLAYRNMKSQWGSCQPATGRICINVRLALYPPACLEYVVVHELCHLIVPGHGPDFYALLDRYLPGWRIARDKLK